MRKIIKVLLVLVALLISIDNVKAVEIESMDDHGLYCLYLDENTNTLYDLPIKAYFKEPGMSLGSDDFATEFGRIEDKSMLDPEIVSFFLEKGVYVVGSNGNYYWECPTDSSKLGISGLTLITKGCYNGNCDTSITPSAYESYTCNYTGKSGGGNLDISYVSSAQYINGKWDITYPDGTTKTYIGAEIKGNLMPSSDCEDIYYIADEKKIRVAIDANEEITNNATLANLCHSYDDSEIEHFCSGTCTYPEMVCEAEGECPKVLVPIFKFIRMVLTPIIQIGIPVALILFGSIDMVRGVMANDEKAMKESVSRFIRRCLAAIVVFFIVTIVTVVIGLISKTDVGSQDEWKSCWNVID